MGDRISSPRPLFQEDEIKKGIKRFSMGSTSAGIVFDVSKEGINVNGYYLGIRTDAKYACLREPIKIPWEELEKIKQSLFAKKKRKPRKKKKVAVLEPAHLDLPDEEYLKTLPVVTINGAKYYIDADRRERRAVQRPCQVFKF